MKIDLSSVERRGKLPAKHDYYWHKLGKSLAVGCRVSPDTGAVTWNARIGRGGKYHKNTKIMEGLEAFPAAGQFTEAMTRATVWASKFNPDEAPQKRTGMPSVRTLMETYIDKHYAERVRESGQERADLWLEDAQRFARMYVYPYAIASIKVDRLRETHIQTHQAQLQDKGSANATINRATAGMRAALNSKLNPVKGFDCGPRLPVKTKKKPYFTDDQRRAYLKAATPCLGRISRAMSITGARPSELRRLTVADVHLDADVPHIGLTHFKGGRVNQLKGDERYFPLTEQAQKFFAAQIKDKLPGAPVFMESTGKGWSQDALRIAMGRARKKSGLPAEWDNYAWRHCFIRDRLRQGKNATMLAKLCGTSTKKIEDNYVDATIDMLEVAA